MPRTATADPFRGISELDASCVGGVIHNPPDLSTRARPPLAVGSWFRPLSVHLRRATIPPPLVDGGTVVLLIAHGNLARWTSLNASAPSLLRCYAEWREILNRPLEEICSLLTLETEEARRLRQNSPFAGVLSAQEVWELKQRFRHATTPA